MFHLSQVAEKMGVPVESQRYWTWGRRQNGTFRPTRPLRPEEEELPMMDLREHRDTVRGNRDTVRGNRDTVRGTR